jgi:TolB-like protein/Flp pilus assembly protein TadD
MGGDGIQPRPATEHPVNGPIHDRLDSWKEIAAYLKKEVRTVQRWEKNWHLPVRRLAQGKQGTVFAYKADLDTWWQDSQSKIDQESKSQERIEDDVDSLPSDVAVLAPVSTPAAQATIVDHPSVPAPTAAPDRFRRTVLGLIVLVLTVAAPLLYFWPQIHHRLWPATPKMTLAVRPFKNMSGDPRQDFVADGLTEEMITSLGQFHPDEMAVIRLSSAYASSDLDRIGKDIHANYVLEGGVRVSGQRVAITAQLFQVSDHTVVWAAPYERDLQDVLRIQAEVAGAIASGVLNKLPHAQSLIRQVNREAYLAYLEGRYFWNKRTEDGFSKAITLFRHSIEIDPTYAPSYAGLADCYELLGSAPYSTLTPQEAFPKAEAAARKALELDSTLAEAHVPLGYSQLVYERNFPEARKEFETAIRLRPGYATAHQFYGYYLTAMGESEEAIAERKKALDLDPISPLLSSALGEAYYHARQFDVTIEQNKKALELDPSYAIALVNIGRGYEQLGMHQQAREAFQTILTAVPDDPAILALMGHEFGVSGDPANANKILARLTEVSRKKYVPAIYFAVIYIGLNRKDDAFHWLDKAYDERCEYLVYLGSEPLADPLRSDPRFAHLLSRIGLKPASTSAELRTQ